MKHSFEKDPRHYNSKQLYFQWLHRRHATLYTATRRIAILLWICGAVSFFLLMGPNDSILSTIFSILLLILIWFPLFLVFNHFLYILPRTISDDSSTGFTCAIFSSPLPTGDIVSGLRTFFIRLNLMVITPVLVEMFLSFYVNPNPNYNDWQRALMVFKIYLPLICAWWFIMEIGIFAASLPRSLSRSGVVMFIGTIGIILGISIGATLLAQLGWELFMGSQPQNVITGFYYDEFSTEYYVFLENWMLIFRVAMFLVPTLILFFTSTRFMENLRRGRWV